MKCLLRRRIEPVAVLVVLYLLGWGTSRIAMAQPPQLWQKKPMPSREEPVHDSGLFVVLAKHLSPAVVTIRTTREPPVAGEAQRFFRRFLSLRGRQHRRIGTGAGVIIHADGYIVTNHHVVQETIGIKVTLATGENYDARLVGHDALTDLALLKIESTKTLPTVPAGDSNALQVGEWVMAIGNPLGWGHTVTAGIVSATGCGMGVAPFDHLIQIDAVMPSGPLFNMRGEVVGINTRMGPHHRSGGIGFAIPSHVAQEILLQLRHRGSVARGWLGVVYQKLSADLIQAFHLADGQGALVAEVIAEGPADKAGIQAGDIIVGFNGRPVDTPKKLARRVAAQAPGKKVVVQVIRKNRPKTIPVVLGQLKDRGRIVVARLTPPHVAQGLGFHVRAITPETARGLRLESTKGVMVVKVAPESQAARAGLRPNDVIREVNQIAVPDIEAYESATATLAAKARVLLWVERRKTYLYIAWQAQ